MRSGNAPSAEMHETPTWCYQAATNPGPTRHNKGVTPQLPPRAIPRPLLCLPDVREHVPPILRDEEAQLAPQPLERVDATDAIGLCDIDRDESIVPHGWLLLALVQHRLWHVDADRVGRGVHRLNEPDEGRVAGVASEGPSPSPRPAQRGTGAPGYCRGCSTGRGGPWACCRLGVDSPTRRRCRLRNTVQVHDASLVSCFGVGDVLHVVRTPCAGLGMSVVRLSRGAG